MKYIGMSAVIGMVLLCVPGNVMAGSIGQGTISISTSSDISYSITTYEEDYDDDKRFNFDVAGGYFIRDNLELELGLWFTKFEDGWDEDNSYSDYGIDPMVNYHSQINENLNLFVGGGIGVGKRTPEEDDDITRFSLRSKIGGEYFLNPLIALTFGAKYNRYTWSSDDWNDDWTVNEFYIPHIGIKVFTTRPVAGD